MTGRVTIKPLAAFAWLILFSAGDLISAVQADDPKVSTTKLSDGLDHPCGVAIQPGTGHVFVAESGAGRILRITAEGYAAVITDFPKGTLHLAAGGPAFDVGPVGIAFIDRHTMAVGVGGGAPGSAAIKIFRVPEPGQVIQADAVLAQLTWPQDDPPEAGRGGGVFGVAAAGQVVFAANPGRSAGGWVVRGVFAGNPSGKLLPLVTIEPAEGGGPPAGVAVSPEGNLVVARPGAWGEARDSRVGFYDAASGTLLSQFAAGLFDVTSIAYSPRSGRLYAADVDWAANGGGGVYRLDAAVDDGRPAVAAARIAELDRPCAIALAPNGALYVATLGGEGEQPGKATGALVRIVGNL